MNVPAHRNSAISFAAIWLVAGTFFLLFVSDARAQVTSYKQAIAETAAGHDVLAAFYRSRNYEPIWTGRRDNARRRALLQAFSNAADHGLPVSRYDPDNLRQMLRQARSERDRGRLEVEISRLFLTYAADIGSGIIRNPRRIDSGIVRQIPRRDEMALLESISGRSAQRVLRSLPPRTHEYTRLMAEKQRFERLIGRGGWGEPVAARALEPGQSGPAVVSLRNRLIAMGYMRRSATQTYDSSIQAAVQQFQLNHGLNPDGVAGEGTIGEINKSAPERLASIIVAMERERWLHRERGDRHILVNLTDFTTQIIDDGRVTFQTRSVIGANSSDRRSPEFSDMMEHMVINPTWNVPRSIAVREYLPMMQRNPGAAGHLRLVNSRGQTVSREGIDFTQFNASNFPFDMKQPPSRRNALGLVKFMFPNQHNIYLHDTPAKDLFGREVRAFSHGCIRLNDPFDFAYALLARQVDNPEEFFQQKLQAGRETVVPLEVQVPVHLIYRTAFTQARGPVNFRRDIYGRDGRIWNALQEAGVALRAVRG